MTRPFAAFERPDGVYLLNHSVGVPPTSLNWHVAEVLVGQWHSDPAQAWPRWETELVGFHEELATLFNHEPQWFCHQVNVSSAVTKILHSLPVNAARPVILLSERTFPSLGYVAQAAAATGYEPRMLPRSVDTTDPNVWQSAMGGDVGIVLVGHAESNTGTQLPVADIVAAARSAGVLSIVDVAQSAGVLPIDLRAWQADVVVGTSVKWLCGGPGSGFLWVEPGIIERCHPLDVGWFSHEDPFAFDINDFRFAPDARRFWGGTPSPLPAAIARHALAAINDIGVNAIHEHNLMLTQRVIDQLDGQMLVSPLGPALRSGTVVIEPGGQQRRRFGEAVAASGIQIDERDEGFRVSPHIVNTPEDIELLLNVVDELGLT